MTSLFKSCQKTTGRELKAQCFRIEARSRSDWTPDFKSTGRGQPIVTRWWSDAGVCGLLHAETEVTVIYSRNKVEAATKQTIYAEGSLQVNIPCSLRKIGACKGGPLGEVPCTIASLWQSSLSMSLSQPVVSLPFQVVSLWQALLSLTLWRPLGAMPLQVASLWQALPSLSLSQPLGQVPFKIAVLWKASGSLTLWRPLGTVPFLDASLWKASLSQGLWQPLGAMPFGIAVLCKASRSLTLWPPLGTVPFLDASLWKASLSQCPWRPLGAMPFGIAVLCKASLSLRLWGTMSSWPLAVICMQEYSMFDSVCFLQPPGTSFSSLNRLRQCGLSDQLCIISGLARRSAGPFLPFAES